jgi:hypothetical protein
LKWQSRFRPSAGPPRSEYQGISRVNQDRVKAFALGSRVVGHDPFDGCYHDRPRPTEGEEPSTKWCLLSQVGSVPDRYRIGLPAVNKGIIPV